MDSNKLQMILGVFPFIAVIVTVTVGGWLLNTWLRIKHGYPLDGAWGQAVYPKKEEETVRRSHAGLLRMFEQLSRTESHALRPVVSGSRLRKST